MGCCSPTTWVGLRPDVGGGFGKGGGVVDEGGGGRGKMGN